MCKDCAKHREAYRSYHLAMTDLGFDDRMDLRPHRIKKEKHAKTNPLAGDEIDTSALDMAEVARLIEEARKSKISANTT